MNLKKWKLGAVVSLFLSLLVAGSGLAAGMTWQAFVAVFCAAAVTHFGAFLKDHPIEKIEDTTFIEKPKVPTNPNNPLNGFVVHEFLFSLAVAIVLAIALIGCASFTTTQTDERTNEQTGEKTKITTQAKAKTLFDSKSALSNFRASQTANTQSATVGSLNQEANSTNAVQVLNALKGIVESLPK